MKASLLLKIVLVFLGISLVSIVSVSVVTFLVFIQEVESQAAARLSSAATVQDQKLTITLQRYRDLANSLVVNRQFRVMLRRTENTNNQDIDLFLDKFVQENDEVKRIGIFFGDELVATASAQNDVSYESMGVLVDRQIPNVDDFFQAKIVAARNDQGGVGLFVMDKVLLEGDYVGTVVLELDIFPVFSLVKNNLGMGETGETLILQKTIDERIVSVTPLRFDLDASLRSVDSELEKFVIEKLDISREIYARELTDYNGKVVYAMGRYVDVADWVLIVKMDQSGVFASLNKLRRAMVYVVVSTVLLSIMLAVWAASGLVSPISKMLVVVESIARGNFSHRVERVSQDEMGKLARGINQMADDLSGLYQDLEQKVKHRTADMEAASSQLGEKVAELEKINRLMVDREMKMIELKKRNKQLEERLERVSGNHENSEKSAG